MQFPLEKNILQLWFCQSTAAILQGIFIVCSEKMFQKDCCKAWKRIFCYEEIIFLIKDEFWLLFLLEWGILKRAYISGWLVGWATHGSSRGPRAQPPPKDLRVSSGNVIAALPAGFWCPTKQQQPLVRECPDLTSPPDQHLPISSCQSSQTRIHICT